MSVEIPLVTLIPSGHKLACLPGRSILDSGLGAGIALPFRCANGSCGECRATLLSGEIRKIRPHDFTLSEAEKLAGNFLMCANTAATDITLSVIEANSVKDIPFQEIKIKLCRIESADTVTIVGFKCIRGKAFRFMPGQKAQLKFSSGEAFILPIASCPCNAQYLEFHLPHHDYGLQACRLSALLKSRDKVTVAGPFGDFTVTTNIQIPKLFVAMGEGFSSIQGLIEHLFNLDSEMPCALVWEATRKVGQYRHNLCRSWADAIDEFAYFPVMYGEDQTASIIMDWQGEWNTTEVYLSGPSAEVSKMADLIIAMGTNENQLFINAL